MAQEFGRNNLRGIQVYMNRSIFLNTCVFLILLIPTLFIESIYEAIGQRPEVAALGAQYVHIIYPFVWFDLVNWAYIQYCTSQRIMIVQTLSIVGGAITHGVCLAIFYF